MRFGFILLVFPVFVFAQPKGQIDSALIFSRLMQKNVPCMVYLPPGHKDSSHPQPFPVLYMLHGLGGNHHSWLADGRLAQVADSLIAAGALPPVVVVMPDAEATYYMNSVAIPGLRYEDFFMQELMPFAETTWHCGGSRANRGIGGLSMGGYGALMYCLHEPDTFGLCLSASAGLRTDADMVALSADDWNRRYGIAMGQSLPPDARTGPNWQRNSVLAMAADTVRQPFAQTRLLLDCGDADPFTAANILLDSVLDARAVAHLFQMRPGGHSWDYWQQWLPMALKVAGETFQNTQPAPIRNENNE